MDTIVDGTRPLDGAAEGWIVGKMPRMRAGDRKRSNRQRRRSQHRLRTLLVCDGVHQLLAVAGANVNVAVIRRWSARQRVEAVAWAQAQIAAWAKDKSGWRTSVYWPEHVSQAHHRITSSAAV